MQIAMQDEDINKETKEGKKTRKRTVTAHEGLMFSSTNPTNKDILEHEKNIETFHKKVPVKVTRYNDAYYEKIKEKQAAKFKTFIGFLFVLIIPVVAIKVFLSVDRKPLFEVKLSDEDEKDEKIKIKANSSGLKAAMAIAKQGSKTADNFEVVGDEDLFDQQGLVGLSKKNAKGDNPGSDNLPDSLRDFTGEVLTASQNEAQEKEKDKGNVIYLNKLFGGSKKDKDKDKTDQAAGDKNKETTDKDSTEVEINGLKKSKNQEGMYFDDPFNLTNIEEFFPKYPTLKGIFEKTKSLDMEFLKQIVNVSKKGIDQKRLDEKLDARFELESILSNKEAASLDEGDLRKWTADQVSFYRDLEKYLVDANKLLEEEKFKYLKWMSIKNRLEKNDLIELSINFSDSDEEGSETKKEFANNWAEYRNLLKGEDSTSKRQKQTELKEKLFNQIGRTSTKIFLTMALLADSMNFSEQEKGKLYFTFKFIDKDLANKQNNKEQLLNGLESSRIVAERRLQEKEAQFSFNEERSSIILKKLNSSK